MRTIQWLSLLLFLFFGISVVQADTITFEDLSDSTPVTTQYPGLVFQNATAITAGFSLNQLEFPPWSGVNVVFDDAGAISIAFTVPITSFSGFFTYSVPITISAFDASDILLGSVSSAFSNNLALSGVAGSSPNEFLALTFTTGITLITITGDPLGSSFTLDDVTTDAVIPEPSAIALFLTGGLALAGFRKRFFKH
jgi:hypothetical protein